MSHEIGVIREEREDNNSDSNKKKNKLIRLKHLKQCCIEEANAVEEIESLYRSEIESIKQKKNCKNTNVFTFIYYYIFIIIYLLLLYFLIALDNLLTYSDPYFLPHFTHIIV